MALPLPISAPNRPTPRVRTPLFLVGVGMALLAFIAMFAFGIFFARGASSGGQVMVVTAAEDIQAREAVTPAMLTLSEVPANSMPPHAFVRVGDLTGFSAVVAIYKGQAITANLVSTNPDQIATGTSSYLPIPEGYVAMTLPTGEQQGVGGYVAPGDYINVIATADTSLFFSPPSRMTTRTVFTNLRVIRVGPPSAGPKEGMALGVASSVTVVLSQCDAQYLEWLLVNATLRYDLLSYKDYSTNSLSTPDPSCPSTRVPPVVGPDAVNARWSFTKG